MHIQVTGKPSKTSLKICKDALRFYGKMLLGKRLYEGIYVSLEFEKFKSGMAEYAFCTWENDNRRPKDFIITIDRNLSKIDTLTALAHEMVHLKQFAKGELFEYLRDNKKCKWMDKQYHYDDMEYWDYPWELDAYGREKGLCIRFMESVK